MVCRQRYGDACGNGRHCRPGGPIQTDAVDVPRAACGRDVDRNYRWEATGNPEYIEQRITRGAKFCVVFTKDPKAPRDFVIEQYLARSHDLVREGEGFLIYRLAPSL